MEDYSQLVGKIVQEAKAKLEEAIPGGEVVCLNSSSGLLRIRKTRGGNLVVVGANSEWLREIAQEVANQIGATVG
jgi:hypothetical protein